MTSVLSMNMKKLPGHQDDPCAIRKSFLVSRASEPELVAIGSRNRVKRNVRHYNVTNYINRSTSIASTIARRITSSYPYQNIFLMISKQKDFNNRWSICLNSLRDTCSVGGECAWFYFRNNFNFFLYRVLKKFCSLSRKNIKKNDPVDLEITVCCYWQIHRSRPQISARSQTIFRENRKNYLAFSVFLALASILPVWCVYIAQ